MTSPPSPYANNGRKPMDLTGQRYARLLVLGLHHKEYGKYYWLCRCDCGKEIVLLTGILRRPHTKSCGCWRRERKPNLTHGMSKTRVFKIWQGILYRCNVPTYPRYGDWGGRGISVCARWLKFENFLADMGEPGPDMSIDRIDNDGNYEPGNCKWSTRIEQGQNKRKYQAIHQIECHGCGDIFMAVMPRAKYCSKQCKVEADKTARRGTV